MDSVAVAKFLSIPTAFLISGYSFGFSQNSVPLVYDQPASISTNVLKGVFYEGAKVVAPGAIISAAGFAYLAYAVPRQRKFFASAAALTVAPLVFTRVVMFNGIQRALAISESAAEQAKADQTGEAAELLKAWVMQNWVRAALSFSAATVGLYASWNPA